MRPIQATSVSGKISSSKSDVKGGSSSTFGRSVYNISSVFAFARDRESKNFLCCLGRRLAAALA